jgi:hypothetical protein
MSRLSVAVTTEAGGTIQVTPEDAKEPTRLYSYNGEGRITVRWMKRSTTVVRRIRRAIEEVGYYSLPS